MVLKGMASMQYDIAANRHLRIAPLPDTFAVAPARVGPPPSRCFTAQIRTLAGITTLTTPPPVTSTDCDGLIFSNFAPI